MKLKHVEMYMAMARAAAEASNDKKLKVGSIIVKNHNPICSGYNGLPEHIDGDNQLPCGKTKPEVRHSEKNALLQLVKSNESAVGATLFVTHACCKMCAIDVVDAGIKEVIYENEYKNTDGVKYLIANGVSVHRYDKADKCVTSLGGMSQWGLYSTERMPCGVNSLGWGITK